MTFKKGIVPWNKGKTDVYSEETLEKMRNKKLGRKCNKESISKQQATMKKLYPNGFKHSEESKQKIVDTRRARDNYKVSKETRQKMRDMKLGKKLSEGHKQKISESSKRAHARLEVKAKHIKNKKNQWKDPSFRKKCIDSFNKPETIEKNRKRTQSRWDDPKIRLEILKSMNTPEAKRRRREAQLGQIRSKETKQKIRLNTLKQFSDPEQRRMNSESTKRNWQNPEFVKKVKEARQIAISKPEYRKKMFTNKFFDYHKQRPTSIEKSVHEELIRRGIFDFIPEYRIPNEKTWYDADFFIFPNLIIECDGDYWHNIEGAKEKDQTRDAYLASQNYKVLRFTETQIHSNLKQVGDIIEKNRGLYS